MAYNSNYITNFNGQSLFDILSNTVVSETVPGSFSNYYGRYFYLGDLLIQFSDFSSTTPSNASGSVTINYPINFPTTPYIVLNSVYKNANGNNVNAPITVINNIGFVCTIGPSGNNGVPMFLAIGPRENYSNSYNISNYNPSFSSINNNLISSTSNIPNDLGGIQITNTSGGYISAYYARFITVGDLKILFTDYENTLSVGHTYSNATFHVYFPTSFFNTIYTVIVSTYGSNANLNYNIQSITTEYFQISISGSCEVIQYLAIGK